MIFGTRRLTSLFGIAALALSFLFLLSPSAEAGFVTFNSIAQSGQGPGDPPAPYGAPTILGNTLRFSAPAGFSATSADGVFSIQDSFTDGFISFSLDTDPGTWITKMSVFERGGRTLLDLPPIFDGTDATSVTVIALGSITVTELDHGNTALTPAAVTPIDIGFQMTWDLANDPGAALWSQTDMKNIGNILAGRGVVFDYGATEVDFFMNNQLIAVSEDGTFAFIDKKLIEFDVETEMIPEPGTLFLALAGAFGVAFSRKKIS